MDFGRAFQAMKDGLVVRRASWQPGWTLAIVNGGLWHASIRGDYERIRRIDMMAEDWEITDLPANIPQGARAEKAWRDGLP